MEDHEIPVGGPSDWQPITNKADLAVLGKLGEEVCEAGGKICRAIIQGMLEADPGTGKINKIAIEDELADIEAMIMHAVEHFNMDLTRMRERRIKKYRYKAPWFHSLIEQEKS